MGRPTKLDDLVAKRIVDAVEAGVSRRSAAQAGGVGWSTLKQWLHDGRKGQEPYAAFLARVEAAEHKAERVVVDALMLAVREGKVPAIQLWLQSRRPHDWPTKPDGAQSDEEAPEAGELTPEMRESLIAALRSA